MELIMTRNEIDRVLKIWMIVSLYSMSLRSGAHRFFWTFDGYNKKIGHCQCLQTCSERTLRNGCLSSDTRPISRHPAPSPGTSRAPTMYSVNIFLCSRVFFFFFYFFMYACTYVHDIRFTFSKLGLTITYTACSRSLIVVSSSTCQWSRAQIVLFLL